MPIPFSNLGITILDALPEKTTYKEKFWAAKLESVWSNVNQLHQYIMEYTKVSNIFKKEDIDDLNQKYKILLDAVHSVETHNVNIFIDDAFTFMKDTRSMCEKVWVQFNPFSMTRGLLIVVTSIFLTYLIADQMPLELLPSVISKNLLKNTYIALVIVTVACSLLYFYNIIDLWLPTVYFANGLTILCAILTIILQHFQPIAESFYNSSKIRTLPKILCRIMLVLSASVLFSNSFIVEEANVLMFLSITAVFVMVFDVKPVKTKPKPDKISFRKTMKAKSIMFAVAICLLIRISFNYIRCREEQGWCKANTHTIFKGGALTSKAEWVITLLSLGLLVTFSRIWLRSCGNLVGHTLTIFLARYIPTVLVVCTGGYWVLQRLPEAKNNNYSQWQATMLARVVYSTIGLGIFTTILKPLCVYTLPKQFSVTADSSANIIPQLFQQVKGMFDFKKSENSDVPIVCGLATVYSSAFIVLSVYAVLLLALLLGDGLAPSAVIMFFCAAFVLVISSLSRYESSANIGKSNTKFVYYMN